LSSPADERQNRYPLFDGHVDLLHALTTEAYGVPFERVEEGPVTLESLKHGGVERFLSALYIPDSCNGPGSSNQRLYELLSYSRTYVEPCLKRHGASDPAPAGSNGKPLFHLLLENGDPLVDLGIPFASEEGIVAVGLTHNGTNRLGDGCYADHPAGLTETGKEMVLELDRAGIVIDLAHLSEVAFDQVLGLVENPPICTHTGLRRFVDTPRNLSDEQVERIIRRGGVVGLCAAPEMIVTTGKGKIGDLFRQIDHLVQRFGPSGVAFGSDFGGFEGFLDGLGGYSDIQHLLDLTSHAGYTEDGIRDVAGRNWQRFFDSLIAPEAPKR